MDKRKEAFERICRGAMYGIMSDDYEVMNPEGYTREIKQHEKDVKMINEALQQPDYKVICEELAEEIQNNIDNQLKCGLKTKSEALEKWQAMKDNK